ncbi:MAG: DUF4836 family protein [Bacteroidota bacterium]
MNRILILLVCCMLIGLSSSQAQSALNHIPADVTAVMSLHPDAIDKKLSLDKIKQMEFYESMLQQMSKSMSPGSREEVYDILKNPGSYGMDMRSGSYVFFKMDGSNMYMNYLFRISDRTKFLQIFNQYLNPGQALQTTKVGNYEMVMPGNDMAMAWGDNALLVAYMMEMPGSDPYDFEEDYDMEEDEEEEEPEVDEYTRKMEEKKQHVQNWVSKVMNLPASSSLAAHPQHAVLTKGSNDMIMWMNYQEVMSLYMDSMDGQLADVGMDNPYLGMVFGQLGNLYQDNFLAVKFNFDKGAFRIDTDMAMNAKMAEMSKAMTTKRVNKKFVRYVDQDNLLGYYAFAFDIESLVNSYRGMVLDAVKDMPMVGDMAVDVLDIVGIAIDEKALYNLFTGDMLLAVTGLREFETMITTYEYDDEFNAKEVQKPSKETLPEFTLMMSYGNQQDLMKFIRLGLHTSVIEQEGSHFKITVPGTPMDIYMAMEDGIFFVSNNTDLIRNRLKSGYSKKERLSKRHCKMFKKHPMVFYWDIPMTMQMVAELKPDTQQMLNSNPSPVREVLMTYDPVTSNLSHTDFDIILVDEDKNSLDMLLQYVQEFLPMIIGLTNSM